MGIELLPEKLNILLDMPPYRHPKEVKEFLGLVCYYRKFLLKFADKPRPLISQIKKDILFEWMKTCHACFNLLKEYVT